MSGIKFTFSLSGTIILIGLITYPSAFRNPLSLDKSKLEVSSRTMPAGTPMPGVIIRSWIEGDCIMPSIVYSKSVLWTTEPKAEVKRS